MFYVYILQSSVDGKLYIGQTANIEKRIARHNSGMVASTKHRKPFTLIASKSFTTRKEAIEVERILKKQKGGNGFHKIMQNWGLAKR